jgi:hypothetical protein
VLTGILFPWFSGKWQDRKQALDIKTSLVSDMADLVVSLLSRVTGVRVIRSGLPTPEQEEADPDRASRVRLQYNQAFDEMNASYQRFRSASAIVGVKLRAYFPKSEVNAKWRDLSELVLGVYALEGIYGAERRAAAQAKIRASLHDYYPALDIAEDWEASSQTWAEVHDALLRFQSDVVRDVLREPVQPVGASLSARLARFWSRSPRMRFVKRIRWHRT